MAMSRTAGIFDCDGSVTTSTTDHDGECPWGGSMPLLPDVSQSVVSSTMNPVSDANATRKPSRAPRLVDNNRYADPQNSPIAESTTSTPRMVGFQRFGWVGPSTISAMSLVVSIILLLSRSSWWSAAPADRSR